jgi:hypothetical protein
MVGSRNDKHSSRSQERKAILRETAWQVNVLYHFRGQDQVTFPKEWMAEILARTIGHHKINERKSSPRVSYSRRREIDSSKVPVLFAKAGEHGSVSAPDVHHHRARGDVADQFLQRGL